MACRDLYLDRQCGGRAAKPHRSDTELVYRIAEFLFEGIHTVNREEQCFLCKCRCTIECPTDPDTQYYRWAGTTFSDQHCLDDDFFDLLFLGWKEHDYPGDILRSSTLREHRYKEAVTRPDMNCRHPGTGIVTRIVPAQGIDNIRSQRDTDCCLPDPFCDSIIKGR